VRQRSDLTIIPPSGLRLSLDHSRDQGSGIRDQGSGGKATPPRSEGPDPRSSSRYAKRTDIAPSWWTARAKAGEVTAGFTKAEILRPKADDPRAEGGVFERVGGLLSELVSRH
jgi:hypothetical protein